jgi:hypothetical protein
MTAPPLHETDGKSDAQARARARRAANGVVVVVAVLFIGASTLQIVRSVFDEAGSPLAPALATDDACMAGVKRLAKAGTALPPGEVDAVARVCASTSAGLDAWAALERVWLAREELARQDRTDIDPLAREVSAHLPADLR